MSSTCDPQYAPAGDVGAALMLIDSRLKTVQAGKSRTDPEQRELMARFTDSLDSEGANDVLDGACTLIFMFMKWLREAYAAHDKDVLAYVVPNVVGTMRMMPRSVRPEAIPTMAALIIAAGADLSPSLWRKQYGFWTEAEMNPLEVTAFLLADHINRLTEDPDFATRLITDALSSADED
ncbi:MULTISPECIES: hypothetical protein [Streptomyces]|uniref:hypothetical protein n=1 Tax=Streptomyces TaxID=1883 RepID=UPI00163CB024|nr:MULTISPECIES: hypothetical protein [Streptomyces]MBC2876966.1 hypothetical protein [Streptomyces sp. TYQ1024]UBI35993.1 hypothetical protein K7I03_05630 [Streptomyces mobaraensis]UKW28586.1 hypothetical protein MCU78_05620 [Streptomyces sp. TYQ1024]